jgi:hypothetical protein
MLVIGDMKVLTIDDKIETDVSPYYTTSNILDYTWSAILTCGYEILMSSNCIGTSWVFCLYNLCNNLSEFATIIQFG